MFGSYVLWQKNIIDQAGPSYLGTEPA